jgi:hypothetical protein
VRGKLAVPGNEKIDLSDGRLEILRAQEESELKPVLRPADFSNFDLEWTFSQLRHFVRSVE